VVGDILGTGIYALTGQIAARVGGSVWMAFVVAFLVAIITAFSYLELVTKYPRARRSRSLHAQGVRRPFPHLHRRVQVMCSGITSSTVLRAFANLGEAFDLDLGDGVKITLRTPGEKDDHCVDDECEAHQGVNVTSNKTMDPPLAASASGAHQSCPLGYAVPDTTKAVPTSTARVVTTARIWPKIGEW
jgi:hypothetical protein